MYATRTNASSSSGKSAVSRTGWLLIFQQGRCAPRKESRLFRFFPAHSVAWKSLVGLNNGRGVRRLLAFASSSGCGHHQFSSVECFDKGRSLIDTPNNSQLSCEFYFDRKSTMLAEMDTCYSESERCRFCEGWRKGALVAAIFCLDAHIYFALINCFDTDGRRNSFKSFIEDVSKWCCGIFWCQWQSLRKTSFVLQQTKVQGDDIFMSCLWRKYLVQVATGGFANNHLVNENFK